MYIILYIQYIQIFKEFIQFYTFNIHKFLKNVQILYIQWIWKILLYTYYCTLLTVHTLTHFTIYYGSFSKKKKKKKKILWSYSTCLSCIMFTASPTEKKIASPTQKQNGFLNPDQCNSQLIYIYLSTQKQNGTVQLMDLLGCTDWILLTEWDS